MVIKKKIGKNRKKKRKKMHNNNQLKIKDKTG